jgi:octaprenyl-diphosphate synthase
MAGTPNEGWSCRIHADDYNLEVRTSLPQGAKFSAGIAFMNEAAEERVKLGQILPSLYSPIEAGLLQVEEVFREVLRSRYPFVDDLVKYGFHLGGKRLRPALVLLSGLACGGFGREHVLLAAAVEMIHTATLVHDDVLDEATIRRHLDTVNARWDNETSVILGDYLFTRALCLSSSLDDVFACRELNNASRIMCEGELRQIESRGDYSLTEEQYYEIVRGKTAALTASCCRLGAHFAAADLEAEAALAQYGLHLGVAFQIADDLLDVQGDEAKVGKSLGTDIAKQKSTLPVIRLMEISTPDDRKRLIARLNGSDNHRREILRPGLENSDSIAYAREKAIVFSQSAVQQLDVLPPSPARDSLAGLAEFVVSRQH